ncbi:hypothetical protein OS493_016309 [Desmophyllum pertusum]|uniref:Uncharacterized protein n=1 Tax=Desmophyllum pertusum TaxID=174260 RepID=A0A9X0D3J2_9CNID|nr:hypothetical protein OS493_016309 [Desmophyllum pertusum]
MQNRFVVISLQLLFIGFSELVTANGPTPNEGMTCSSPWQQAFHNDANGNVLSGSKCSLKAAVLSGARVRVVLGTSYSTEADNVNVQGSHVFAQLLQHVSKASWDKFQDNAYWWWAIVSTDGVMYMTRYNVGSHTHRGTNSGKTSIKWYVQTSRFIPKPTYSHLANGNKVQGSLNDLESRVQNGQDIRCVMEKYSFPLQNVAMNSKGSEFVTGQTLDHIPEWNYYTAEADNLSVRNGHVTAQALKHVSKNGLTGFQNDAYWYWLMVSTTGTVRATRYNVGEHKHRGDSTNNQKVKWFVDTRPWEQVLSNDKSGNVLGGCQHALVQAVKAGTDVRCVQGNEVQGYAYKAQNLAVSPDGNHVAAQSLSHVSMTSAPNQKEVMIQSNAYWWFTIVSSTGLREMSRWTVGKHVDRGHTSDKVGQKWFVNH